MAHGLDKKVVLITGAARGIGYATAERFAEAGCKLVLTDLAADALAEAAQTLRARGAVVETHTVDVADRDQVEAMANQVLEVDGGLDILINNAGIGYSGELAETSIETWQKLMSVNFWGPLYHVYAFLPAMRQRGRGHIVNVSSGQAFFRLPTWGAYAAIKLALGGFSEILHYELAPYNIHVTTVYPYMVNTGFYGQIEAKTLAARLSLRLLPYYSDTPEKVGRIIFNAVRKRKRVEMVSLLNDIGFYSRFIPHVSGAMSRVASWLLSEEVGRGDARGERATASSGGTQELSG